ncbi:hypothetical protein [Anaeromyxobacter oryzae]|uniref:Outer membrane protein beta-barrel domain-containing protein n=1 Tax=Anaeromyxobacter oryzae TaxID=2918170 RepID=A0ABN6MRE0_9BACT|nr:hypothetical protein [Anaeromyxobacter oryzae]BDG03563.1 hypothetical protein AMOR_25590 [Anaeromyxobacter oryzae]
MPARHRTAALALRAICVLAAAAAATAARGQTPEPATESRFQLAFGVGAGLSSLSRTSDGPERTPEAVFGANARAVAGPLVAGAIIEGGTIVWDADLLFGGYLGLRGRLVGDHVLVVALQAGRHHFERCSLWTPCEAGNLPFAGVRIDLERSDAEGPRALALWLSLAQDARRVSVPSTPPPGETGIRYGGTVLFAGVSFRVGARW